MDLGGSLSLSGGPVESAEALCLGGGLAGLEKMDVIKIYCHEIHRTAALRCPHPERVLALPLRDDLCPCVGVPHADHSGRGGQAGPGGKGGWCSFVFCTFYHGLLLACKLRFIDYTCSRREK